MMDINCSNFASGHYFVILFYYYANTIQNEIIIVLFEIDILNIYLDRYRDIIISYFDLS